MNDIGLQITKFRKKKGLTQEQLGMQVGVSAQAVSKWENGGLPDTSIIPIIADCLDVSIDVLFGRRDTSSFSISEIILRHVNSFPRNNRMDEVFRILCEIFKMSFYNWSPEEIHNPTLLTSLPTETCYTSYNQVNQEEKNWNGSMVLDDNSIQMGILSKDFPMYYISLKPENGYLSNFSSAEAYAQLFSTLSDSVSILVLETFHSIKNTYYSPDVISSKLNLPKERIIKVLDKLSDADFLDKQVIETNGEQINAYRLIEEGALIPFLQIAKWFTEKKNKAYFIHSENCNQPLL